MYYKQVELKEGELVLFVGCHVLKWPYDVQLPDVGFVEADDIVEDLLIACKKAHDWLDRAPIKYCNRTDYMEIDDGAKNNSKAHAQIVQHLRAAIAKAEGREQA